jgi:hypothetical protein
MAGVKAGEGTLGNAQGIAPAKNFVVKDPDGNLLLFAGPAN